jgi:hypothetical protein
VYRQSGFASFVLKCCGSGSTAPLPYIPVCFLLHSFCFDLGSAFSPVVRASLVGSKADAPGCRELGALGVLVVSAGCLRHKTGNVTVAAHMISRRLRVA